MITRDMMTPEQIAFAEEFTIVIPLSAKDKLAKQKAEHAIRKRRWNKANPHMNALMRATRKARKKAQTPKLDD